MTAIGFRAWLLLTGAASAIAGLQPARAQTAVPPPGGSPSVSDANPPEANGGAIQDIVVTAQKRSERLQNVPIAITALSSDALASKGLASTIDITAATPGLNFTEVAGQASPRIRGVGTTNTFGGNENSIATYVDGVYYASSNSTILSLNNIDQVAVLKGPQGTLFGRNATGGLIQITTLDPTHEFSGKASATYGNLKTVAVSIYLTGGLTERISGNLAVNYDNQMEGFGRNLFNGRDVNKTRDLSIRAKLKFDLGAATTLMLSADYDTVDAAVPDHRPTYGSLPITRIPFTAGGWDANSNIQPLYANQQGGISATLTHHFNGFDLTDIAAYRRAQTHVVLDVDGLPIAVVSPNSIYKDEQYSNEKQVVSTAKRPSPGRLVRSSFGTRADMGTEYSLCLLSSRRFSRSR